MLYVPQKPFDFRKQQIQSSDARTNNPKPLIPSAFANTSTTFKKSASHSVYTHEYTTHYAKQMISRQYIIEWDRFHATCFRWWRMSFFLCVYLLILRIMLLLYKVYLFNNFACFAIIMM